MGLHKKTLLIIGVVLAILLAVLYFALSSILLRSFSELESQYTGRNAERARDAILQEVADLEKTLVDWSAWDETYDFVDTGDPAYVQRNLDNATLTNLRLNLVLVIRYPDRLLYGKALDLSSQLEMPLPDGLEVHLATGQPLVWHPDAASHTAGVITLPQGPLLVAARPVLTSDYRGPIRGVLVVGRFLDAAAVQRLSDLTHLSLALQPFDNITMPSDFQSVRGRLFREDMVVTSPPGSDSIAAYTALRDIYGRPAVILRVYTSRDIYRVAQTTLSYLLLALLVTGLIFGEATVFLLERLVLSRVARLNRDVTLIGDSGDLSARVELAGKDELSSLAASINSMLAALEVSQRELRQTQELLEQRVQERTGDLARIAGQLEVVNRIARAASSTLQLDDLLEVVYQEIATILPCDSFLIALYDDEAQELEFRLQVIAGARVAPWRRPLDDTLEALVIRERRALCVNDLLPEQSSMRDGGTGSDREEVSSWLGAPMSISERVVGLIAVQSDHPDAYREPEERLLALIADQVAVAIENARLYTATQSRADELAMLNDISIAFTSELDFAAVVRAALSQIQRLFHAHEVALLQTDTWTGDLRFVQTLVGTELRAVPLQAETGEGLAGWTLAGRCAVWVEDAAADPRFSPAVDQHDAVPPRSLMAVPLLTPDYAIGVIEVIDLEPGRYGTDDMHMLQAIASTLTIALVNARLYNDIKTLLREREQAQGQLVHAEKMSALGRLVASIAHEINNPLQAVQFCLSMVEEDVGGGVLTRETTTYLNTIQQEVERVSNIVHRMRDFYRPTREGLQSTDLHSVLDGVLDLSARQLENNRITVEREWEAGLPHVQSNPDHLKQIFLNLVLNAIDAMPNGGVLRVSTQGDALPSHESRQGLPAVRVNFSDTGIGMSPEVQAHLFEPFFTTKEHGSGLGLSVSYGILQSLNGQIRVESAEGEGSTFSILLPVEQL